ALDAAAAGEFIAHRWNSADSLLTLLLESGTTINPRTMCDAFLRRSYCRFMTSRLPEAQRDLQDARAAEHRVHDPGPAASAENDRLLIEGLLYRSTQPAEAIRLLSRNVQFAVEHDGAFALPALYYERSQA